MASLDKLDELIDTVSESKDDDEKKHRPETAQQRLARIKSQAQQYIEWEPYADFSQQVSTALKTNDTATLLAMFGQRIAFGTAGLRSAMRGGYAFMNDLIILQTTQGLIRYLETLLGADAAHSAGVIIGYDARHHSSRFAALSLALFRAAGFKIYHFNRFAATPLIPFGILQLKTCAGIVVTASHNPKADNGFKVYLSNGAQIIPPHDAAIAKSIMANLKPWSAITSTAEFIASIDPLNSAKHGEESQDVTDLLSKRYFSLCPEKYSFVSSEMKAKTSVSVTFTPMHGVGGYWMTRTFEAFGLRGFVKVEKQFEPDPEFSTVEFPNPEEGAGALKLAMETADAKGSALILANDPDSDRLAVAEKQSDGEWYIMNGNEIAALLAWWVWKNMRRQDECVMLASTVSSKFLAAMAEKEGFEFIDTLTGFKWMGNVASELIAKGKTFLFAYEVEIGFVVGDVSLDKDGLRCAAIFSEMAIWLREEEGIGCVEKLQSLRAQYGYFEMEASYRRMSDADVDSKMGRLRNWDGGQSDASYAPKMGEFVVSRVRDVTTGWDSGEKDKVSRLPRQASQQMITFWFENGATATIRNSGTEPKLKYYVETRDDKDPQKARALLKEMTAALLKEFMQMD